MDLLRLRTIGDDERAPRVSTAGVILGVKRADLVIIQVQVLRDIARSINWPHLI